jgi:hypothetical protein
MAHSALREEIQWKSMASPVSLALMTPATLSGETPRRCWVLPRTTARHTAFPLEVPFRHSPEHRVGSQAANWMPSWSRTQRARQEHHRQIRSFEVLPPARNRGSAWRLAQMLPGQLIARGGLPCAFCCVSSAIGRLVPKSRPRDGLLVLQLRDPACPEVNRPPPQSSGISPNFVRIGFGPASPLFSSRATPIASARTAARHGPGNTLERRSPRMERARRSHGRIGASRHGRPMGTSIKTRSAFGNALSNSHTVLAIRYVSSPSSFETAIHPALQPSTPMCRMFFRRPTHSRMTH